VEAWIKGCIYLMEHFSLKSDVFNSVDFGDATETVHGTGSELEIIKLSTKSTVEIAFSEWGAITKLNTHCSNPVRLNLNFSDCCNVIKFDFEIKIKFKNENTQKYLIVNIVLWWN